MTVDDKLGDPVRIQIRISRHTLLLALILVIVTGVYANHFNNGFHFDDYHTIVDNPYIRTLHNVPRFFMDGTTFSVLPPNQTYRPFVTSVFALDYALGHGYKPFWFQATTFVVFLLQLIAMYVFFRAILNAAHPGGEARIGNAYIALAAVTWYGLHPAMSETVNYIIQCGDIFSTFGIVAAFALYVKNPFWRRTRLYLLPFVFGILSKPPALVFPVLLFVYSLMFEATGEASKNIPLLPGRQESVWKARLHSAWRASLPAVIACTVLTILQIVMTPKTFLRTPTSTYLYLITQPFVLLRYFCSFFLPVHLNVDTDLHTFPYLNANAIWGFIFLLLLLTVIWITARRRITLPIAFGLSWFVITSLPTSLYRLAEVENDHRMFMPFVGLVLAAVWGIACLVERFHVELGNRILRLATCSAAIIALAGYAWGTHVRNQVWSSEDSLWLDDVYKSPENGRGLMVYGLTQMNRGKFDVALDYYNRAQRYTPNYSTLDVNLGIVLGAMNRPAEAEPHFRRAIALRQQDDQTHFYYGRWLVQNGRLLEGLHELQLSNHLNPSRLDTSYALMHAYELLGDQSGAQQVARQIIQVSPGDSTAQRFLAEPPQLGAGNLFNAALAQFQTEHYKECIADAQQALHLRPDFPEAWNLISAAYGKMNDFDKSIAAAKEALRLKPDLQMARQNLETSEKAMKEAH